MDMSRYRRLRDLREDKDLTQAQVAAALHISTRAYGYYESGERTIPPEILISLAKFHKVNIDYLLEVTDYKKPYPSKK